MLNNDKKEEEEETKKFQFLIQNNLPFVLFIHILHVQTKHTNF